MKYSSTLSCPKLTIIFTNTCGHYQHCIRCMQDEVPSSVLFLAAVRGLSVLFLQQGRDGLSTAQPFTGSLVF